MTNKRRCRILIVFLPIIILAAFITDFALAEQAAKKPIVVLVRVKGNKAISTPTILSKIKTKPGSPFSQEVANDDIKRLYALGYFTDVAIDVEDYESGLMVTMLVEEKPVVKKVIFEGNKKISARRLKKLMQIKDGSMLKFSKLSEDITEIKSFYERNGFYQISVKYELERDSENQVTVKIIISEKARIKIKQVYIEGNKSVKTKKIKGLLTTKPAWLFNKGYFDDNAFESDLNRIKMYYQEFGFLDVSVTPAFDYERDKGLMYITLKINEGAEYHIGVVSTKGKIVFPKKEILDKIALKSGDVFSYNKLRSSVEGLRAFYYYKGYMNALIDVDRVLNPETKELDIIFKIDPKDIVYIGKINISGNNKTKDVVIRRELRAYPGERFDGNQIRRSKERLYNLGFFEDIFFETRPSDIPNVSNLNINVKETKTGEFSFGGGYSSVDEFIGFVQITQKNFDLLNWPYFTGDGQYLSLKAEIGMGRRDFDLTWTEPWIFDYPVAFGFDAYHRTHLRKESLGYGFQEVRAGGDLRLGKEFWEYFKTNLMYRIENVNISNLSDGATDDLVKERGDNWLSTLVFGIGFDNRDNVFSPTKGFVTRLSLENTGGFLFGDKNFMKGYYSASLYYSPIKKIVVEFKIRAGLAGAYGGTDDVPIYERFYAGGANTIRGYKERKVGPRDPSTNDPLGGNGLLVGNVEVNFPIYEKVIKGAIFYDIGNVWKDASDFALEGSYMQGAGVGVRIKTPIGPIKLDWGYPLVQNHDDKQEGEFYFSVSRGF